MTTWHFLKSIIQAWSAHNATRLAAALAYYTIFSLTPLLVISIAIMGLVLDRSSAQQQVVQQIGGLVGQEGGQLVNTMITSASSPTTGVVATILGVVVLLIGATGVFGELQSALNLIWGVAGRQTFGWRDFIFTRLLSFTMVLVIGFLLLVSLVTSAIISAFSEWISTLSPAISFISQTFSFAISFSVTTLLFGLIFKLLPDTKIAWRDVGVGAAVTAVLYSIGRLLIGLYLGHSSVSSIYGASGSLVVLLIWVYYSAQILFFGAEFTQVYANRYGSRRAVQVSAEPIASRSSL